MTSSLTANPNKTDFFQEFRKRGMAYALTLSVVLHVGAALAIIIAGSFGTGGQSSSRFVIEDVSFAPSITAPKTTVTPPAAQPAMTEPTQSPDQETAKPAAEAAPEQSAESTARAGQEGGVMSTPLGLGMTHGYFSGLADGRTLRDDIRGYYFEMVEKINKEWWEKAGLLKEPLRQDGIFELLIQRDGTIVSIRILQGTGLVEADRLLTEIIKKASPLPPLPDTYNLELFRAPLRIKAPSFLFRLKS